jgi:uncharacterized protein YdcH (DUF465 family)
MSSATEAIREHLMVNNSEYQRLRDEHAHYSAQLDQLASKKFLSDQEQAEEVRLKKLKLRAKDQMELLVRRAKGSA